MNTNKDLNIAQIDAEEAKMQKAVSEEKEYRNSEDLFAEMMARNPGYYGKRNSVDAPNFSAHDMNLSAQANIW